MSCTKRNLFIITVLVNSSMDKDIIINFIFQYVVIGEFADYTEQFHREDTEICVVNTMHVIWFVYAKYLPIYLLITICYVVVISSTCFSLHRPSSGRTLIQRNTLLYKMSWMCINKIILKSQYQAVET